MTSPVQPSWVARPTPNIRPGFPSGGEILAPAWSRCWGLLNDLEREATGGFPGMTVRDLAEALSVHPTTLGNLLRAAAKVGLVDAVEGYGQPGVHALAKLYRVRHPRGSNHYRMFDHFTIDVHGKVTVVPADNGRPEVARPRQAFRR